LIRLLLPTLGYSRAIVHDTPGTTRDVVTAFTALAGWPVELSDTAGLRDSGDTLEAQGIQQATERMASADLVVLVFDASVGLTAAERYLIERWPRALCVGNKRDLITAGAQLMPGILYTSAVHGDGVEEVAHAIAAALVPHDPPRDTAVPFTLEQVAALSQLRALVHAGQMNDCEAILRQPALALRQHS
jgi:tRNA modification GTPase